MFSFIVWRRATRALLPVSNASFTTWARNSCAYVFLVICLYSLRLILYQTEEGLSNFISGLKRIGQVRFCEGGARREARFYSTCSHNIRIIKQHLRLIFTNIDTASILK